MKHWGVALFVVLMNGLGTAIPKKKSNGRGSSSYGSAVHRRVIIVIGGWTDLSDAGSLRVFWRMKSRPRRLHHIKF